VEAVSNNSTVALRVVRGDENGTRCLGVKLGHPVPRGYKYGDLTLHVWGRLESETVKYGHESRGTRTGERLRWRRPAAIVNDRPVLSSGRAPHTKKNPQESDSNKNVFLGPSWGLDNKTDWPTDRRSQHDFDFDIQET
jgi:hypothetical protein